MKTMHTLTIFLIISVILFHFAYAQNSNIVNLPSTTLLTGQISIIPDKDTIMEYTNDTITDAGHIHGGTIPFNFVWYENFQPRDGNNWLAVSNGALTNDGSNQFFHFNAGDNSSGIHRFRLAIYDVNDEVDYSNIAEVKVVKGSPSINTTKIETKITTPQVPTSNPQPKEYTIFEGIIAIIIAFFGSIYGWKIFGAYMTKPKPPKPRSEELMDMLQNSKFASDFITKVVERKQLYPFLEKLRAAIEEKKRSKPHDWENQT
ncbi:MAG: hypothetical protein KGI27_01795 [Thaumarchaeota archaeon]|nr:hypothetical protein [Nitrososphaerota archaeon]